MNEFYQIPTIRYFCSLPPHEVPGNPPRLNKEVFNMRIQIMLGSEFRENGDFCMWRETEGPVEIKPQYETESCDAVPSANANKLTND
jgi:hypothetical protein